VTQLSYDTSIAPGDHMWATGAECYFDVGLSALQCVKRSAAMMDMVPTSILDMPCGHGRVCRMLRAEYPNAHITVCDLDSSGVDFCAKQFAAEAVYSNEDIRKLTLERSFQLIWCGSLFTHLDEHRWRDFLLFFTDHLLPDGVLVFTTHGRQPIQWMQEGFFDYGLPKAEQRHLIDSWRTNQFGFVSPGNQAFGISLSSLSWVCAQVESIGSLKVIGVTEAGWAGHQDVFTCTRLRKPYPERSPR
jgi:SAM-dependent methyltransferase